MINCPFKKECDEELFSPCIHPRGNLQGKYLVLGIAPGDQETKKKMYFVGPSGNC